MGLRGEAAIVGVADSQNERKYTGTRRFQIEQFADLTRLALEDAGLNKSHLDGICCASIRETNMFAPATLAEYLGLQVNFPETVDLGGVSPVGMIWRAAAAIELGICQEVVCAAPARPIPSNPNQQAPDAGRCFGSTSPNWGTPTVRQGSITAIANPAYRSMKRPSVPLMRLSNPVPAICYYTTATTGAAGLTLMVAARTHGQRY
jgi:acetyl-CoA C-acetyltransferase